MKDINEIKKEIKNPPAEYRSAPYWAWNDRLNPEELAWQIKDMRQHGMGGGFMHSREGLETTYLSPEWMECVKATAKAAKETGAGAWLYDEDRWPAGSAGGRVGAKGDDYRAKALTIELTKGSLKTDDSIVAAFKAVLNKGEMVNCRRISDLNELKTDGEEVLMIFRREIAGTIEWYNDSTPPDNLNPSSVQAFIDITYEAYKKEMSEEFGKAIPGSFNDETMLNSADFGDSFTRGWIPWTDGFPEFFIKQRKYEFLDYVPYMFFEGDKSAKIRHDYWRTITERLSEVYMKYINKWCAENNLILTGHLMSENELGDSIWGDGAIMPHYRYMDMPGIDMLCEQTTENLTVKQCSSVANQYGKKRVLTETYGCSGWAFTFEGQKWMGDWQYVLGVNFRCPHLTLYSLKGCRKRDYPPTFSYNTSWWKYNNIIEDYFARIALLMSEGQAVRDVLVIHPISTAWAMSGSDPYESVNQNVPGFRGYINDAEVNRVNEYGEQLNSFARLLLASHYDFDFGDEIIMEEEGRIKEGKFFVNKAGYHVVVVPPVKTLFKNTIKLLKDFADCGGKIIAMEPLPSMIEGEDSAEMKKLFENSGFSIARNPSELIQLLEAVLPRRVSILDRYWTEASDLLYLLKDLPDSMTLFIANNDRHGDCAARITVGYVGKVEEVDLLSGDLHEIGADVDGNKVIINAYFGPADSKLYIIHKNSEPKQVSCEMEYKKEFLTGFGPACKFTRTMPNALTLDRCMFKMEDSGWSEEMAVWEAQSIVRQNLGMRQIYYNSGTQRYKWVDKPHPKDGTQVSFKLQFNVKESPATPVFLVLETSKYYSIQLNGTTVENKPCGWYMDKSFDMIRLPRLKTSLNELILSCAYLNKMEVEDCYIIGDFGVDPERNIIAEPAMLRFGDWTLQGYMHYCGSMVYHFKMDYQKGDEEKVFLELGDYKAVVVEVRINGKTAGILPWKAIKEIDISDYAETGENSIDIEVMGSPRNLLGPFHQAGGDRAWTDWIDFRRTGLEYTPDYIVEPYGLFKQVKLYKIIKSKPYRGSTIYHERHLFYK